MTSIGRKAGLATSELGGVASTEATVMLDVNPYVRFPLLVMNLMIWLIGLALLLVGAYAYVDTWTQSEIPTHSPSYNIFSMFVIKMEISVMLFGVISMSLSFCGCVGALRENSCLLNVYSSFITALLLINLVVGLVVFFLPSQIKKMLSETFSMELIVHYRDSPDFQRLMDSMQERMQCCGISRRNFRDWNANMYFNCSRANPSNERCSVPYSCCKRNSTDQVVSLSCGRNVLNMTDYDAWFQVYTGNCLDSGHRYVRENVTIITGLCLVFVILLAFVQMVTQALLDEILIIRRIYEKFYERAYDMRAAHEQAEPTAN
ncbi:tetraspanin-33-like [Amblyomma americanum]